MQELRMKPHGKKGKLISFCGLDGCGKSSMIAMLSKKLAESGVDIFLTRQPTDMMRNTGIFRTFMDSSDNSAYEYRSLSLMAAADRLQHVNKVILPALAEGKTVICDRYFYSCLANLRARGYKDDEWIYEIADKIVKPDVSFFLDVHVGCALQRVRARPEEKDRYIDVPLQYRLRNEYIEICKSNGGVLLSSDGDINSTFDRVYKTVSKIILEDKNERNS